MKICNSCNKQLELNKFNRDSSRKDGYKNICSFCSNLKRRSKPSFKHTVLSEGHKECNTCNQNKILTEFNINRRIIDGRDLICKNCRIDKGKKRYLLLKEEIKERASKYYYLNKKYIQKRNLAYQKRRCKEDPFYLLSRRLRNRLYYALRNKNWSKSSKFTSYIGCDRSTLIEHIEAQFKEGMNWDNYGQWHLDHIIPLDSANTEPDLYKLCHYTNLQPLWALDNIKKSNKTS